MAQRGVWGCVCICVFMCLCVCSGCGCQYRGGQAGAPWGHREAGSAAAGQLSGYQLDPPWGSSHPVHPRDTGSEWLCLLLLWGPQCGPGSLWSLKGVALLAPYTAACPVKPPRFQAPCSWLQQLIQDACWTLLWRGQAQSPDCQNQLMQVMAGAEPLPPGKWFSGGPAGEGQGGHRPQSAQSDPDATTSQHARSPGTALPLGGILQASTAPQPPWLVSMAATAYQGGKRALPQGHPLPQWEPPQWEQVQVHHGSAPYHLHSLKTSLPLPQLEAGPPLLQSPFACPCHSLGRSRVPYY